jgi:hypothetical protein
MPEVWLRLRRAVLSAPNVCEWLSEHLTELIAGHFTFSVIF